MEVSASPIWIKHAQRDLRTSQVPALHRAADLRTVLPNLERLALQTGAHGGFGYWQQTLQRYRGEVGLVRGWAATALIHAAFAASSSVAMGAKEVKRTPRPWNVDPTLLPRVVGKLPPGGSNPSAHTAAAHTAAAVMSVLDPEKAPNYHRFARRMGTSRIASSVHFPEDIAAGSRLGNRVAKPFVQIARLLAF